MQTKFYLLFDGNSYFVSDDINKDSKVVDIDYNKDLLQKRADKLNSN